MRTLRIDNDEPEIVVNGDCLSRAEAMTIRVALETFAIQLRSDGCGDDEHGKAMTDIYTRALQTIRRSLYRGHK